MASNNSIQDSLTSKMMEIYNFTEEMARGEAERFLSLSNGSELETNLTEWLNGKPISDVHVGKWCVRNVLEMRGHAESLAQPYNTEVLQVIYALLQYTNNPGLGETLIYNIRK